MLVIGVIGPEPAVAISAISSQHVLDDGKAGFLYHHDTLRDALYVGLRSPAQQAQEATDLKAALLLFLTSHAVVWALPPGIAPTSILLGTLRLLQQAKQLLLPSLPDLVPSKSGREAAADTQPPWGAPPLLLFVCQAPHGAGSTLSPQQREQAQAALDGQLQSLVRRCRVLLPEDHPAALCTLRAAGTTWLLGLLGQDLFATMQQAFAALRKEEAGRVAGASTDREGGTTPRGGPASSRGAAPSTAAEPGEASAGREGQDAALLRQLRSALSDHLTGLARAAGTGGAAAAGGGVSFASWRRALCALAAALQCATVAAVAAGQELQQGVEGEGLAPEGAAAAAAWIAGCTGLARGLSESKCQRAAAAARDAYLRSMPPMYPQAQHTAGVQAAVRLYRSLARGPANLETEARLLGELDSLWQEGRQQCPGVSLLGHACTLPLHDAQEVPHSSGVSYLLASPDGERQVPVADPFPPPPGTSFSQPPIVPPIQPGPHTQLAVSLAAEGLPPQQQQQQQQGAAAGGGSSAAAPSHLACVPLLVRQDVGPGAAGAAGAAAAASHLAPAAGPALPPSGCFLEVTVLGAAKAAQGGLRQPGFLHKCAALHRFVLQVTRPGAEADEEFPALRQPDPVAATAAPIIANWPGPTATASPAAQQVEARAPLPASKPAAPAKRGKKGGPASGTAAAGPPAVFVGVEYESLQGARVILSLAQLAGCVTSSLDDVKITSSSTAPGGTDGSGGAPAAGQPGPSTDALANAAAEAAGAAAAAAAASKRAAAAAGAAGGGGGAPASAPMGGPAAELMLAADLPLFLQLAPESTGGGGGKKGGGRGGGKPGWWQLRRFYVATPPGGLQFVSCPQLQLEFPAGMPAEASDASAGLPAEASDASAGLPAVQEQLAGTAVGIGQVAAAGSMAVSHASSSAPGPVSLSYQPREAVRLPPDSLCCIALPWIFTRPSGAESSTGGSSGGRQAAAATSAAVPAGDGGAVGTRGETVDEPLVAAPLPLAATPVRALLVGSTVLQPEGR